VLGVYWTTAWSTVTVIGPNSHRRIRGKTVCRLIWESPVRPYLVIRPEPPGGDDNRAVLGS
jgi:hypothetical protein